MLLYAKHQCKLLIIIYIYILIMYIYIYIYRVHVSYVSNIGRHVPLASHVALVVKNLLINAGNISDVGSIPGSGRFPWRRAWQPTPVVLPGDSHAW